MKKFSKKSLQQLEDYRIHSRQLLHLKGGDGDTTDDGGNIVIVEIISS